MVSLEDRLHYLSYIEDKPKLKSFYCFINSRPIEYPAKGHLGETEILFYDLIIAIQKESKKNFTNAYNHISKRKPTKDSPSPFVHDDFLIIILILGILKFSLDKHWIQNIINLRNRNSLTITLDNLLNENYNSKSNVPQIVVTFLSVFDLALITGELLDQAYKYISNDPGIFDSQHDVLILSTVRSYDLIIDLKLAPNSGEIDFLKKFEKNFSKRVGTISIVLYNILLFSTLYGLTQIIRILPKHILDQLNEINLIIGIFGVGVISGNAIGSLKKWFKSKIYLLFGYDSNEILQIRKR